MLLSIANSGAIKFYFIFLCPAFLLTSYLRVMSIDTTRFFEKRKTIMIKHLRFLFPRTNRLRERDKSPEIPVETIVSFIVVYSFIIKSIAILIVAILVKSDLISIILTVVDFVLNLVLAFYFVLREEIVRKRNKEM